jgi:hypothetical protein
MIDRLHNGGRYVSRAAVIENRASEQPRSPLSHHSEQPAHGAGDDHCRNRR